VAGRVGGGQPGLVSGADGTSLGSSAIALSWSGGAKKYGGTYVG
jgi:hypothetical protein